MANLNQLKCPSCGAVLEFDFQDQNVTTCPYCHQQVVYKDDDEETNFDLDSVNWKNSEFKSKTEIKKYGVPFKDSDDEFREKIIQKIAYNNGTPLDVFSKAIIQEAKKFYLPLYYYWGNFQASWSSMVMHYKDAQRINYQGKLENYKEEDPHYLSGNSTGRFESIASAVDMDSLNKHIYSYLEDNKKLDALYSKFVLLEDNDKSVNYLSCDYSSESAWISVGESWAEANAYHHRDFPGITQSFSVSFSERYDSLYYIPVRMVEFIYEGKSYRCMEVLNEYFCDYPIIEGYSGDTEDEDSDDPGCWIAIGGSIIAFLLYWFFMWLYKIIGLRDYVELSYISTWLPFFFTFLYFRRYEFRDISSEKYKKEEALLLADYVVIIFLSIGVTYVGSCINDYIGITNNDEYLCFAYFILSFYLLYKFRSAEINRVNERINAHNDKIGTIFASYRKQKLDSSNSFNWNWNKNAKEGNVQANDKLMSEIVNCDLEQLPTKMYCRYCGRELKIGYKFCGYCGKKQ